MSSISTIFLSKGKYINTIIIWYKIKTMITLLHFVLSRKKRFFKYMQNKGLASSTRAKSTYGIIIKKGPDRKYDVLLLHWKCASMQS